MKPIFAKTAEEVEEMLQESGHIYGLRFYNGQLDQSTQPQIFTDVDEAIEWMEGVTSWANYGDFFTEEEAKDIYREFYDAEDVEWAFAIN